MTATSVIDLRSSPAGTQSRVPPSSHRLATVSASDALQDLDDDNGAGYIPTGLPTLDAALGGATLPDTGGGLERGKVTGLWGSPGAGTTAIALQATANALRSGNGVVWVDCATPLSHSRLKALLESSPQQPAPHNLFTHHPTPTLSHLLTLILHPLPSLLPPTTTLLVIDNLNTPLETDYPRAPPQPHPSTRTDAQKWRSTRRYALLATLIAALSRLAATRHLAVLATTGCAMRSRPDTGGLGGALTPGVGGAEWDAGEWNRMVVFRDFGGRFVGLQKCRGRSLISREEVGETGRVVGFEVGESGVRERQARGGGEEAVAAAVGVMVKLKSSSPVKSRKRYVDEVADSEGEDEYGWDAGDEDVFAASAVAPVGNGAEQVEVQDAMGP